MLTFVFSMLAIFSVGIAIAGIPVVVILGLSHLIGGQWRHLLVFALLLIIGTIPPAIFGVLWYAVVLDNIWAMKGPGVFSHLGSGVFMLAAFVKTLAWTSVCWIVATMQVKHIIRMRAK